MEEQRIQATLPENPSHGNQATSSMIVDADGNVNGSLIDQLLLDSFPPGYRFRPYDHELILSYLEKKVRKKSVPPNKIHDVDIYQHNPETLAERYKTTGEAECYFFTPRDRKYLNGQRPNRAAGDGYWKATGADKAVKYNGVIVGFRRALVFYKGRPSNGEKTTWIMHEFTLNNPPESKMVGDVMRLDDCVLCRIYKKEDRLAGLGNRQSDHGHEVQTQQSDTQHLPAENSIMASEGNAAMPIGPTEFPQPVGLPFSHHQVMSSNGVLEEDLWDLPDLDQVMAGNGVLEEDLWNFPNLDQEGDLFFDSNLQQFLPSILPNSSMLP